ncbi:MAG: hypothetical protein K2M17_05390, partial [Bacilli bacterium]|nr:hypothetical protein [Bacilli bacterium]
MKLLSSEVKNLLDKLYNLRGEDSVILKKMNKEREDAIETQERTKNEKTVLLAEIESLTAEEATLAKEGNRLMDVLSSINRDDFATVLDRLRIDFDPEALNSKVTKLLPETIEKVVSANKQATEKLENVETEMNNAITKVEELGIRKDEALSNQARLNEYFELALSGNINITRDEITNLLGKFDFTENEQREAAKILMFPEDALYEYDVNFKNNEKGTVRTITDVLAEAKKESATVLESAAVQPQIVPTPTVDVSPVKKSVEQKPELTATFERVVAENAKDLASATNATGAREKTEKEKLDQTLIDIGLSSGDFTAQALSKLLDHYDEMLFKANVTILKNKRFSLDIVKGNAELLFDNE